MCSATAFNGGHRPKGLKRDTQGIFPFPPDPSIGLFRTMPITPAGQEITRMCAAVPRAILLEVGCSHFSTLIDRFIQKVFSGNLPSSLLAPRGPRRVRQRHPTTARDRSRKPTRARDSLANVQKAGLEEVYLHAVRQRDQHELSKARALPRSRRCSWHELGNERGHEERKPRRRITTARRAARRGAGGASPTFANRRRSCR